MAFFKNFNTVDYFFGNEKTSDKFQNISLYADVIDQVKNDITLYQDYHVLPGERPDQVSMKLYDRPDFYWTFFLVNDELREFGWPLSNQEAFELAKKRYHNTVITTRTVLTDKFKPEQTITGATSGASATIDHRELDLGQLYLRNQTGTFSSGEQVTSTNGDGDVETITINAVSPQYNAARHYINASKELVDIDPTAGPGAQITEVTWADHLIEHNESLQGIRIIQPQQINTVVDSFKRAVKL